MNVAKLTDKYYYYKEPIGYGSFSIIYKGYSVYSQTPLAIKRITKIIDMKYFYNEVEIMKKIDHPNILKLLEVVKTNGNIYLILEYCNGGDMSNYINNTPYNKLDIEYCKQIFSGLEYLYINKIMHRDMKPHNILIHNNTIKISDFGFAKSFEKNELISTFCGSPLYMAPEIIKTKEYDHKSDIWSLGVIIYELLCRKHPYHVDSKTTLWKNVRNGLSINFESIDNEEIREIIRNMLIEDPKFRIDWNELFRNVNSCNFINTNNNLYEYDDMLFEMDLSDYTKKTPTCSVILPKKKKNDILAHSVNLQDYQNSLILENEDYKIISRSAPHMNKSYLNNYIIDKQLKNNNNLPILGKNPKNNNNTVESLLTKSYKTVKNLFGYL
tara:strand:+ start:140 stop:1288 length:1149 start_codon:yes stop_codon:yes gene_type:complete